MSPSRLFSYRYWIVLPVLFLLTMSSSLAQIFKVYQPDVSKYPKVSSYYTATQQVGQDVVDISGLDSADFEVVENGIRIDPKTVTKRCSTIVDGPSVCVVLVIDKSGSMGEVVDQQTGSTRFDFVKQAAQVFVNAVNFVGNSRVAVVSFDGEAYLEQEFSNNRTLLNNKINDIVLGSATKYDPPMLDPRWGALQLLKDGNCVAPTKRVVIFLTDGNPNEPPPVSDTTILNALNANGIIFYAITAFSGMNKYLQKWAEKTGGKPFVADGQDAKSRLVEIYKQIANELQSKQQCYLEWPSPMSCDEGGRKRNVEITLKKGFNITSSTTYTAPANSVLKIDVSDPVVFFGDPDPAAGDPPVKKTVTVTAKNGRIVLTSGSISTSGGNYILLPPNDASKFPIVVDSGKSVTFEIEFTQSLPKNFRQGTFVLKGIPCDPPIISLVAGLSQVVLLGPGKFEKEVFQSCEDITIRWAGIKPEQQVIIQYSLDDGATWNLISDTATGLSYVWSTSAINKLPIGTKYKIRIQIPSAKTYIWAKSFGGVNNDSTTSIALSQDGLYEYISGGYAGSGVAFGSVTLNSENGSPDGFVSQIDGSGNVVWANSFGGSGDDKATGVAAGPNNVCYVTGYYTGEAKFGSRTTNPNNKSVKNFFMARYSSSGQLPSFYDDTRSKLNLTGESYGTEIAYDPSDNRIYVHGMFKGRIKDESLNVTLASVNQNVFEPFTAIFRETGEILLLQRGKNELQRPYTKMTATDKDGCIYTTNKFGQDTTIGSFSLQTAGNNDAYVSKFCGVPASSDVSNFPFAIAKPDLVSVDKTKVLFRFKNKTAVGVTSEESIETGICNYGTITTEIIDVDFTNDQFELTSALEGRQFTPPNCDTVPLIIKFTPKVAGDTCTDIIIYATCSDPVRITVCAEAIDPCTFTKKDVDFPATLVGGTYDTTVTEVFCNTSNVQLSGKLTLGGSNPEDFEILSVDPGWTPSIPAGIKDTTFTLNPGKCITVKFRFKPSAAGNRTAFLHYNIPSACGEAKSLLNGRGLAPLALEVGAATWTCTRPGTKVTQKVTIKNIGTSEATINSVNAGPAPFSLPTPVAAFPLAANTSKDIDVEFAPATVGTYTGTLTVNATATSGTKDFTSALSGESCVPVVSLSKNCFDLTAIGSSSGKSDAIIVSNTGNFDLNVTAINVLSGDVGAFNTPGFQPQVFTVQAGAQQPISGTFTPGTVGLLKALVEIVSDGIPGRDTIEVCGTSFAADTTIDFGTILVCERPTAGPINYSNPSGGLVNIDVSSDNPNFVVTPSGLISLPSNGTPIPFTITFAPTVPNSYSGTIKIGPKNVQVKGTARVTPIDYYVSPSTADNLTIRPGDITKVTVKADVGGSLSKVVLDTMNMTFTYNDQLFTIASNNGVPITNSILPGWTWTPTQSKGMLKVGGKGPAIVGPATGMSLFSVDFVGYLADKLVYTIATNAVLPAQYQTCLPTTSKGTEFILDDNICFVAGRLINTGSTTYQLHQPKPTPAVNEAKIEYGIGLSGNASIELVDAMGQKVMTLIDQPHASGNYEMTLDVSRIPAGVYFYVLRSGPYLERQKLVITK